MKIRLPVADGRIADYRLQRPDCLVLPSALTFNRVAYAAAHIVVDPAQAYEPWSATPAIDRELR